MKILTITSPGRPITPADLAAVEERAGLSFPAYFRDFLLKYSGCLVKEGCYEGVSSISGFLPLRSSRSASIEMILEGYRMDHNTREWLPFAIDAGGWIYAISLAEATYGQVWLDRFNSGENNPFKFIAASFESFIDQLSDEELF